MGVGDHYTLVVCFVVASLLSFHLLFCLLSTSSLLAAPLPFVCLNLLHHVHITRSVCS